MILHIYADYDKRIGAYKITYILGREEDISDSVPYMFHPMAVLVMRYAPLLHSM